MSRKRVAPAPTVEHFGTAPASDDSGRETRWWNASEKSAWESVFRVARLIESQQATRQRTRLKHVRLYGNREIAGLSASKYANTTNVGRREDRIALNVCKSCVDTAAAKISKNKPRALFLTSGGDGAAQDKAKKLTKFTDGMFEAAGVYAQGQAAFVDSCVVDTGVVKISDDGEDLTVERVSIDELRIDEVEGYYGAIRQIHQVRQVQVDVLTGMFPDFAHQIKAARSRASDSAVDHVEVIESWHLRSGKKAKDGKRAMCIDGCTLLLEDYSLDYLPFVFLYWTPPFRGFFGQGLVEELVGIQVEINRLLRTIQEAQHLACVPRVYFDAATAATLKPVDNEMGGHYSFVGRPPTISTANAMPSEIYQHLWALYAKAYEVTGISQMGATGKKPAGLDSGAALREYSDIESERFVLAGQRLEEFYMNIARQMIGLMRLRNKNTTVKARDGKFVETIDWKTINLSEDEYEMQVFPVSLLPSSPAGRLQTVKELVKDGFISDRAQAMKLLDFPDLEAYMSLETAAEENINRIVDGIIQRGEVTPPDRYINIALARRLAQAAYERGEAQGRDRDKLDALDAWMTMLDDLEDAQQPPPAPAPMQSVPMGDGPAPPMVPQAAPPVFQP